MTQDAQRERMLAKAREYQIGTYSNRFVAPVFQKMIRAEYAARPLGLSPAMFNGVFGYVFRERGQCVCITCGKVGPWKGNQLGGGVIESGHFIASRRAAVLFEENNVHPQCKLCNQHLGGNQGVYEIWMREVFGQDEIDRLRQLLTKTVQFTREELVDRRIRYASRLKFAEESMRKMEVINSK